MILTALKWTAVVVAALALAIVGLTGVLPPKSDCLTRTEVSWLAALPYFAVFVVLGGLVTWRGDARMRLTLFVAMVVIMVLHVYGLALTLEEALAFERHCAQAGYR